MNDKIENGILMLVAVGCALVVIRGEEMQMPHYLVEYATACAGVIIIFMIMEAIR